MYAVLWSCLVYWMCRDVADGRVARAHCPATVVASPSPNKNEKHGKLRALQGEKVSVPPGTGLAVRLAPASRNYVILRSLSRKVVAKHRRYTA